MRGAKSRAPGRRDTFTLFHVFGFPRCLRIERSARAKMSHFLEKGRGLPGCDRHLQLASPSSPALLALSVSANRPQGAPILIKAAEVFWLGVARCSRSSRPPDSS